MDRIKSVNRVFLATVIISIAGSVLNEFVYGITGSTVLILLLSQLMLIIPSAVYLYNHKINVQKAIRFHKIKLSNIVLIVIFAYLISPLMSLISALSMLVVKNDTADFMNSITSNNPFLVSLFLIAFIPCILEESVYRGIFFNEYSKVNPLKAIFLSGFLFGIIHGNLNQFSYAFAMGIVFALLIEATDSILATMIVHFFINGSSVVVLYLYPKVFRMLETLYGSEQFNADELIKQVTSASTSDLTLGYVIQSYGLSALVCSILAFIVFRTIAKNTGRWDHVVGIFKGRENRIEPTSEESYLNTEDDLSMVLSVSKSSEDRTEPKKLVTISLIIGIIICVILAITNELTPSTIQEQSSQEFYTIINSLFSGFLFRSPI